MSGAKVKPRSGGRGQCPGNVGDPANADRPLRKRNALLHPASLSTGIFSIATDADLIHDRVRSQLRRGSSRFPRHVPSRDAAALPGDCKCAAAMTAPCHYRAAVLRDRIRRRGDNGSRNAGTMRTLCMASRSGRRRCIHLQLRMHVLRDVRQCTQRHLPELWRRAGPPAAARKEFATFRRAEERVAAVSFARRAHAPICAGEVILAE